MDEIVLKANRRTLLGKQVKAIRREGKLPAVIYGHYIEPISIVMDLRDTAKSLAGLAPSALVTVDVDGETHRALVREKQRNYVKGNLIHVDFQVVSLTEKIRANISIELTGSSPAVKDLNAVLVTVMNQLEVECFPQDLPERVVVDISGLANIGDGIHIRDIILSEKVQVLEDMDEMVVLAAAPKQEVEEVVAPEAEVAAEEAAEPEVIEKGKKEEEVPEEGEKRGEKK
jgi:large subunit ribosomal protein L25